MQCLGGKDFVANCQMSDKCEMCYEISENTYKQPLLFTWKKKSM